ncbi:hypothetical protein [Calothrix sp. NIES-3974]|uniref:hypothetical protein n=1 Tax=Calothrix sp. NIES-3974 TaxID=2005462 RepID=UPI0012FDD34B
MSDTNHSLPFLPKTTYLQGLSSNIAKSLFPPFQTGINICQTCKLTFVTVEISRSLSNMVEYAHSTS